MTISEILALLHAREVLRWLNRNAVFVELLPERSRIAVMNAIDVVSDDLREAGYEANI